MVVAQRPAPSVQRMGPIHAAAAPPRRSQARMHWCSAWSRLLRADWAVLQRRDALTEAVLAALAVRQAFHMVSSLRLAAADGTETMFEVVFRSFLPSLKVSSLHSARYNIVRQADVLLVLTSRSHSHLHNRIQSIIIHVILSAVRVLVLGNPPLQPVTQPA